MAIAAIAEIEPTIGTKLRTVQICAIANRAELTNQWNAFIGYPIAVLINEFPKIRKRRGVDGALMKQNAAGKGKFVGKDCGLIILAIAISIDQPFDAVGQFL